jgi:hypothetical protein
MSANSYGVVVEGQFDSAVYDALIRRLTSNEMRIKVLQCGGKANLIKKFPALLRTFEYEIDGAPVDMAVVIVDADGKAPFEVEEILRARIQGRQYPFRMSVRPFAVSNAMDAWLLADVLAISAATQTRGGKPVNRTLDNLESLLDPKVALRKLLTDHKVTYTAALCREIAQTADLEILSQRCPRFRAFAELVDC